MHKLLPAPRNGGFRMNDFWVWCGSVVPGDDGRYHMFASRWPKFLPMHPGWIAGSEIVRTVSDTPEGPYEFQEVVLPSRGAEYWDGRMTHNPHIIKYKDKYLLFYTGSTHPFPDVKRGESFGLNDPRCIVGRSNKRIGLAISKSVFGPWERLDKPILTTRPDHFDSFMTSNPAPCFHGDGSVILVYKARAYKPRPYEGSLHGDMTLGVAFAQHYLGPYKILVDSPIFEPEKFHLEDPFIWRTENGYKLIAKDMDGRACGEKYGGAYAFSKDGLHWEVTQGIKAYSRKIRWDDGTVQIMGNLERPFILFRNGKPTHFFAATSDGMNGFHDATNTWNMVIPIRQI